mgnify:CR=1 FL=1
MNNFEEYLIGVLLEGESTGWSVGRTMRRVGRTVARSEKRAGKLRGGPYAEAGEKALAKQKSQSKRINRKLSQRRHPEEATFPTVPMDDAGVPEVQRKGAHKNDPPSKVDVGVLDTPAWRKARGKRNYYKGKKEAGKGPGGWPETVS